MADTKERNGTELGAPIEERLAAARAKICTAFDEAVDEALSLFVLPSHRLAVLEDAAKFTGFLSAVKAAEVMTPAGQPMERRSALKHWWKIEKAIKAEVPPMLLEFGKEAEAARVQGAAEAEEEAS